MSWLIDPGEWKPLYEHVKSRLRLSFEKDQEATDVLSRLLEEMDNTVEFDEVKRMADGKKAAVVFGCGRNLVRDLGLLMDASTLLLIAADGATTVLLGHGVKPDIVVTDLDGYIYDLQKASAEGAVTVVHAHGDNMHRVEKFVKGFKGPLIGSTQVEPRPHVYNFGGFTDGDRAAFLAYALGIREIYLAGFDLTGEPSVCPGKLVPFNRRLKKAKLEIASLMLKHLSSKGVTIKGIGEKT
ncbi:6-hydroxymethylpterin diphosphokinase MptE-like protein [Desulfurococcus mucosus]|uniref:6-hydroxymethyl-7,8-dihydropterin pyrophosphokinase n=1 Tax=Desulfurococcus mucosus (strain ATCC 35584 / DSM 2162 / JCM 9187 / O7/1) TaxID=765177 RepID=E8R9F3_DESM0|nr:6-hydroxymethylpterin diphosphokinase MptE-like protein [Desulfurococcus mucosus]ADV65129.1 protein of unknown function DUF115 [Desulfurococcus mucosus DSM 2162]